MTKRDLLDSARSSESFEETCVSSPLMGALLISPPTGNGNVTRSRLHTLRSILECTDMQIANLLSLPTATVEDIDTVGALEDPWLDARAPIVNLLHRSDHLVLAWGLGGGFGGQARVWYRNQVRWVSQLIADCPQPPVIWMVGREPRHPSRWHQYVSDRHGRTSGGDLSSRLRQVLHSDPVEHSLRVKRHLPTLPH